MQQLPAADVEVGGGYVEGMAVILLHKGVKHAGHFVLLVVDDEGDAGHWLVRLFSHFSDYLIWGASWLNRVPTTLGWTEPQGGWSAGACETS